MLHINCIHKTHGNYLISVVQAFTDYDGSPINLVEQKDINEFAGMLFDKLESNKEGSALLSRTIKGKILWRTQSIETPYKSDREESFFMVTVEVKVSAILLGLLICFCVMLMSDGGEERRGEESA